VVTKSGASANSVTTLTLPCRHVA